jgi:hypothetical protein
MAPSQQLAIGALLQYDGAWVNVCTGTLVTDRHVLTAAHARRITGPARMDPSELRFAFGTDAASPLRTFGVRSVHVNPLYSNYFQNGLRPPAIIELDGHPRCGFGDFALAHFAQKPGKSRGALRAAGGFGIRSEITTTPACGGHRNAYGGFPTPMEK